MSLLLLASLFASVSALLLCMAFAANGQAARARAVFLRWGIGAAAYLAILLCAAAVQRESRSPYCDDDWCIAVDRLTRTPAECRLDVRIFSLANHGRRSARGAWIYLTDDRGRRFELLPDSTAIPFDVALDPHQSVATSLTFQVPADARNLSFIGGLPGIRYASLIIGNGDLLGRPRLRFRLP